MYRCTASHNDDIDVVAIRRALTEQRSKLCASADDNCRSYKTLLARASEKSLLARASDVPSAEPSSRSALSRENSSFIQKLSSREATLAEKSFESRGEAARFLIKQTQDEAMAAACFGVLDVNGRGVIELSGASFARTPKAQDTLCTSVPTLRTWLFV